MKSVRINTDDDALHAPQGSFENLKNRKKVDLLQEIDLSKYDEKMIRLLLDGDYKGELKQYKNKVMMLVHEIIDKKIPHTKFGVNTLLYKLVRDARNDRNASANLKERKPKAERTKATKKEPEPVPEEDSPYLTTDEEDGGEGEEVEEKEEEEMIELDFDDFVRELLNLARVNKRKAIEVLNYNIPPTHATHKKLLARINKI